MSEAEWAFTFLKWKVEQIHFFFVLSKKYINHLWVSPNSFTLLICNFIQARNSGGKLGKVPVA